MRTSSLLIVAGLAVLSAFTGSAFAQPVISIEGSCPTRLTFRWEGAPARSPDVLFVALETGRYTLPAWLCDGTVLGLGSLAGR